MIVVVKQYYAEVVYATHTDAQLADVLAAYPDDEFDLCRTDEAVVPRGALPTVFEVIERSEAVGG